MVAKWLVNMSLLGGKRLFLNNGLREEYTDVELVNARLLNIFSLICFLYTFVMGISVFLKGEFLLGTIDSSIAVGYVFTIIYFGVTKNSSNTAVMVVSLLFVMELFLLLFGGKDGTGYLWFYAYPLISFILLGEKKGAYYNLLFLIPMVVVFYVFPHFIEHSPFYQYNSLLKSRVLLTYIGVSFLTFTFSYIVTVYMTELEKAAKTDILTQLPNRRDMRDKFTYLWEYNKRKIFENSNVRDGLIKYKGFSLAIADIDFFKKVNDTHGHAVGDMVLKKIADTFKASLRAQDIIARWGGEEFLILLPDTGVNGAFVAFEKVRKDIEKMQVENKGKLVQVTISIGYITCKAKELEDLNDSKERPDKVIDTLLDTADKALYQAKLGGRNRIRLG